MVSKPIRLVGQLTQVRPPTSQPSEGPASRRALVEPRCVTSAAVVGTLQSDAHAVKADAGWHAGAERRRSQGGGGGGARVHRVCVLGAVPHRAPGHPHARGGGGLLRRDGAPPLASLPAAFCVLLSVPAERSNQS